MKHIVWAIALLALAGCGGDEQEIRDQAFEEGYDEKIFNQFLKNGLKAYRSMK